MTHRQIQLPNTPFLTVSRISLSLSIECRRHERVPMIAKSKILPRHGVSSPPGMAVPIASIESNAPVDWSRICTFFMQRICSPGSTAFCHAVSSVPGTNNGWQIVERCYLLTLLSPSGSDIKLSRVNQFRQYQNLSTGWTRSHQSVQLEIVHVRNRSWCASKREFTHRHWASTCILPGRRQTRMPPSLVARIKPLGQLTLWKGANAILAPPSPRVDNAELDPASINQMGFKPETKMPSMPLPSPMFSIRVNLEPPWIETSVFVSSLPAVSISIGMRANRSFEDGALNAWYAKTAPSAR